MKVTIGELEVIETQTLLIPNMTEAWVEFKFKEHEIRINIKLIEDNENPNNSSYSFTGSEDHTVFELKNWNGQVAMAIEEPSRFWGNGEDILSVIAFGHKVGAISELHLQFYRGAPE